MLFFKLSSIPLFLIIDWTLIDHMWHNCHASPFSWNTQPDIIMGMKNMGKNIYFDKTVTSFFIYFFKFYLNFFSWAAGTALDNDKGNLIQQHKLIITQFTVNAILYCNLTATNMRNIMAQMLPPPFNHIQWCDLSALLN